jgi:2-hydroxychromene-2-carboxylate isomerase
MGDLIRLDDHRGAVRRNRRQAPRPVTTLHFDLACPFTYLALERIERLVPEARWQPTPAEALHRGSEWRGPGELERACAAAERRAREVRLPLVWPLRYPLPVRPAMRAALRAVEEGRGAAFALAASRLAFCGGYDLDDPEVLAEAAAAAGVGLEACLSAAGDERLDRPLESAARRLLAAGADRLPAIRMGRTLYCGEERLALAVAGRRLAAGGGVAAR